MTIHIINTRNKLKFKINKIIEATDIYGVNSEKIFGIFTSPLGQGERSFDRKAARP